jgi:hypothetical protein
MNTTSNNYSIDLKSRVINEYNKNILFWNILRKIEFSRNFKIKNPILDCQNLGIY